MTVTVTGGTMEDERCELLTGRRHKAQWRAVAAAAKQTEQFSHVVRAQVASSDGHHHHLLVTSKIGGRLYK